MRIVPLLSPNEVKMDTKYIYEGIFERGEETFRVAILAPQKRSERSWKCGYVVDLDAKGATEYAVGTDSLQALALAIRKVRRLLIPLNVREKTGKSPPELIFPDFLPVGYGFEFHRFISALVELEITKKELELSVAQNSANRRSSRKGK